MSLNFLRVSSYSLYFAEAGARKAGLGGIPVGGRAGNTGRLPIIIGRLPCIDIGGPRIGGPLGGINGGRVSFGAGPFLNLLLNLNTIILSFSRNIIASTTKIISIAKIQISQPKPPPLDLGLQHFNAEESQDEDEVVSFSLALHEFLQVFPAFSHADLAGVSVNLQHL